MNKPIALSLYHLLFFVLLFLAFLLVTEPASAATAGGGLPFEGWLTKVQSSITGPFAYTASVFGLIGAGAALIFGGEMTGLLRTLIFFVLAVSFVIAGQNTLTTITGKSAEIPHQWMA